MPYANWKLIEIMITGITSAQVIMHVLVLKSLNPLTQLGQVKVVQQLQILIVQILGGTAKVYPIRAPQKKAMIGLGKGDHLRSVAPEGNMKMFLGIQKTLYQYVVVFSTSNADSKWRLICRVIF